jgi:hypothetical protein
MSLGRLAIAHNGWQGSEVPFGGILASALSADRQAFNRLLAEVALRCESSGC